MAVSDKTIQKSKYYAEAVLRKLLLFTVFLFVLSVIVFLLARLSPGDPLLAYYGDSLERMSEAQREAAISTLGLDKSIVEQYLIWTKNIFTGDLGISYAYKQPVGSVIGQFWFNTLLLSGISFILSFLFAALVGIVCAARQGTVMDMIIRKVGTVTSVLPEFFVSLVFILIFAVSLRWFPVGGAYSLSGGGMVDRLIHLVLPVSVMVICHLWYYAYMIRNKLIEEFSSDYVSLLRMKGVSETSIIWKHCLRNILPTVFSMMVVAIPHFIGGTYIVEMVFSYPGLGLLSFESAMYHDYNMLSALCLITGTVILFFNLAGERYAGDPYDR